MNDRKMKVGLLLNPKAGVGGPVGLKGSDGVYGDAMLLGGQSKVADRAKVCLERIDHDGIEWFTVPGEMGGDSLGHVSSTHLTLPTTPCVLISVVPLSSIKKFLNGLLFYSNIYSMYSPRIGLIILFIFVFVC